jgi:hypothetical protein
MTWNTDQQVSATRYAVDWRRASELLAVALSATVWMLFLIGG